MPRWSLCPGLYGSPTPPTQAAGMTDSKRQIGVGTSKRKKNIDERCAIAECLCIYVRGLAKILWSNTSGYIVGTYY